MLELKFWGRRLKKKRLSTFWDEKCTLAASVPPPNNVQSWLCAWVYISSIELLFSHIVNIKVHFLSSLSPWELNSWLWSLPWSSSLWSCPWPRDVNFWHWSLFLVLSLAFKFLIQAVTLKFKFWSCPWLWSSSPLFWLWRWWVKFSIIGSGFKPSSC